MDTANHMMHYCKGTWVDGFILDCEIALKDHNIKLTQSMEDNRKARKVVARKEPDQ